MQALRNEKERFTYADYINWDDSERWELIDGIAYAMSPAPSREHQEILRELFGQLYLYLRGKPCKVFVAPFDVRLSADANDDTVVQPDIMVICDESKLDDKGCVGAPDLIIEILSPASTLRDRVIKFNKYLQAGVREYWIVEPDSKSVSVHLLENGRYYTTGFSDADVIQPHVLEGCTINLQEVFR